MKQVSYVEGHRSTLSALQGKSHLYIPFLGIAQPLFQFPHSCVCERSFHIFSCRRIGRPIVGIYSECGECVNLD